MAPVELPIDAHLEAIVTALEGAPNLVVVAEPGAGKTTRVPPALAGASFAKGGQVWVLEPRRLAARMSAQRVAEEQGERIGESVGFAVRFERKQSARTRLLFLTEALLVRQMLDDPELKHVSAVVLDEFHERSIHTDLALALLLRLQRTERPDLRIVVMSATLDADALAAHLDAETVRVSGRTFPVDIQHLDSPDTRPIQQQVEVALRRAVLRELPGDVLVFLPGAGEIRRCLEATEALCKQHALEACMLHGDMPSREQDRVLTDSGKRKVIFSTNIAETSLTLPRVGVVVDSGLARVSGHSPWSGLPTLETAPISQASAVQRAGRAGRVRAGTCFRLFTHGEFLQRRAFDVPELRRADLAETRLLVSALGESEHAGAVLPWFEAPPESAWRAATQLLRSLSAIDARGALLDDGRAMLRLPVHPRLSRVALSAAAAGYREEGASLAALLGERDVRRDQRLGGGAAQDVVGDSDVLAQLDAFEALGGQTSADGARRHGLDANVVRAVARTRERLLRALPEPRGGDAREPGDGPLLRALLAGYPDRVAKRRKAGSPEVVFAAGGSGTLAPTSVVKEAEFLVAVGASEQRGSVSVRVASAVEADWLFEVLFDQLEERDELRFDAATRRVEQRRRLMLGQLVLEESSGRAQASAEVAQVLTRAALSPGQKPPWDADAVERIVRRARFAHQVDASVPELGEQDLSERVARLAEGCTSFDDMAAAPLEQALPGLLGDAYARLERLAPSHVKLPSGRKLEVHYELDRPPWVKSRLQDFFGMPKGPSVAEGREVLVLHLLAPNQRPVQVTTDLAGFWERHYPSLRRELMRRYPRHAWPEDPTTASPPPPGGRGRRR